MVKPTVLSEIANLASPVDAPKTIAFSSKNKVIFYHLRMKSFPHHHSQERGGTIVADHKGHLSLTNIGGTGSTSGSFSPDLTVSDLALTVVGIFHTHPYDVTEGSMTGVSFSGGDIAYLINRGHTIMVVQSGPRLFVLLRTNQSPSVVQFNTLNNSENAAIQARVAHGRTFQQASRIEAQVAAPTYNLAYYQGMDGVVTRVYPQ